MPISKINLTSGITGVLPSGNATYSSLRPNAKPLIYNGNMAVAQRGTSSTSISAGNYYTCDRWKFEHTGNAGTFTLTQSTDVPSGYGFFNSFKMDCTTAQGTIGAANRIGIRQKFEGLDLQGLKKGTANAEKLTLAFWVKSTKTGTFIAELYDVDNARQISKAYTVSSSNTWEQKVINFPADTTGALGNDANDSFILFLWTGAGTNFTSGTLNSTSWASSTSANRAVGQVNASDSTSNDFLLTGVQLEIGEFTSSTLPPFQHETYGENLNRCLRYYQNDALYSNSGDTAIMEGLLPNDGNNFRHVFKQFPVPMRAAPTITNVNWRDDTGDSTSASQQQGSQLVTSFTADVYGRGNVGGGDSDTNSIYFHGAEYSAEL